MKKLLGGVLLAAVCLVNPQTSAQEYLRREPVALPADAKAIFLAQMLGHMVGLDGVITALGRGEYKSAAEIADAELGTPRFQDAEAGQSREQGPGLGVGRHLPAEFRAISLRFREAADDFADLARGMPDVPTAKQQQALTAALSRITNQCRICRDGYRIE